MRQVFASRFFAGGCARGGAPRTAIATVLFAFFFSFCWSRFRVPKVTPILGHNEMERNRTLPFVVPQNRVPKATPVLEPAPGTLSSEHFRRPRAERLAPETRQGPPWVRVFGFRCAARRSYGPSPVRNMGGRRPHDQTTRRPDDQATRRPDDQTTRRPDE